MITEINHILTKHGIEPGPQAADLGALVINTVVAEIAGDLRAELLAEGSCPKCLELRSKAIDLVLAKAVPYGD